MFAEDVEITVLVENSVSKPSLLAEHGLSFYVRIHGKEEHCFLYDTGQSGNVLLHNAEILGIDFSKLSAIVLSHGHYDHTGGLIRLLDNIKRKIPVIMHPYIFYPKYKAGETFRFIGNDFTRSSLEQKTYIITSRKPVKLLDYVWVSGEIERTTDFEKPQKEFYIVKNDAFQIDNMNDEISLIIRHKKGLIILTGCGHPGIINTILHAKKITGEDKIYTVLGGFHLISASDSIIEKTIEYLSYVKPEIVAPCHCTGFKAKSAIAEKLVKKFNIVNVGSKITL